MIKLLFVGDIHLSEHGPQTRKDNYMGSIITKLDECFSIAESRKCNAIIFMGDIFDMMEPSGKCRNETLQLFLRNSCIEKYTIIGNHDVKSHLDNIHRSALGTLIEAGALIHTDYIDKYKVHLFDYYVGIEDSIRKGMLKEKSNQDAVIIASHASITDSIRPYNHVIFNEIEIPDSCKLLVGSHIHEEMKQYNDKGQLFVNPASLCRNKLENYHVNRDVKVLYVQYEDDGSDLSANFILLQHVIPGKDVFHIDNKIRQKEMKVETSEFVKQIYAYKSRMSQEDKYEALRKSGKEKNIDQEVVELAISTLINVNERIK